MLNLVYKRLVYCCIAGLAISILVASLLYAVDKPNQTFTMPEKYYRPDSARLEGSAEQLFSPSVANEFYRMAHQTTVAMDVRQPSEQEVEQAIFLIIAATNLDPRAPSFASDIINLASRNLQRDYSQILFTALAAYIDESSDIEVVRKAFRYLLEQLNSRDDRENFLKEQLKRITGKNAAVESEISTMLGLLAAEKADVNDALSHFMTAYNSNKYNRLAFEKLVELSPRQITLAAYLEHLRLIISENPLDIKSVLAFAQQSERSGLYDTAAEAYQYCADLFNYLQPSAPLPAQIYLPLAISSYNSTIYRGKPLQLVKQLRQSGRFDLLAETIAAKASEKAGDTQQAESILQEAQSKALELVRSRQQQENSDLDIDFENLAWFYCFAVPDANKAIDFANKAYSANPASQMAGALLAYALVSNGQNELAKSIVDNSPQNQISLMALAKIQLASGMQDVAIETLKNAIAKDPAALEAEKAKQLLAEQGGTYMPPADADAVLATLKNGLGDSIGLQFVPPEKIIAVQFNIKGSKFSYGTDFGGSLTITNNSMEPLVISNDGLFTGQIRIDAAVTGDIEEKVTNVVTMKIHPSMPVARGRSMFIPLPLDSGRLNEILSGHPQASLNIEFTAYLDPVTAPDGKTTNRLTAIASAKTAVSRPGIVISSKYLQNRLNSLAKGQQGQKIKTSELITGLLMEQQDLAKGRISYKMAPADWMPTMLISALAHNLSDADWVISVHTMADLLPVSLDYELTNAVSENLNDTAWPCRLMAEFILAKKQQAAFKKVLDWSAKNDPNKFVRDMAVALGGDRPPKEKPQQAEKTETKPPAQTTGRITEPNKPASKP